MFFYPIMPLAATFYEHATPLGSIFTFPQNPFWPLAAQNSPKTPYLTPWGHMSITNIMAPGGTHSHKSPFGPWRQNVSPPPSPPGRIYFLYKSRNGRVLHPSAYDNQVFGTIYKNEIGAIADVHVSRGRCCGYHFSVCI